MRKFGLMAEVLLAGLMMGGEYGLGAPKSEPLEHPERKCLLPTCDKLTTHNGGYCCAEHCREHRAILKTGKKP